MSDAPPPPEWELKLKWVILAALFVWGFAAVALVLYLIGSRNAP